MGKEREKEKDDTDYRALYAIGVIFMGVGIALAVAVNIAFMGIFALGLVFFMSGAANRDKWKTSKK